MRQNIYEIIYHVKMERTRVVNTIQHDQNLDIMQMLYRLGISCRFQTDFGKDKDDKHDASMQNDIKSILENELGYVIDSYVIDYNLLHVGYLLENPKVFVPLHSGFQNMDQAWSSNKYKTVFIDTMYSIIGSDDKEWIRQTTMTILRDINTKLQPKLNSEYYKVEFESDSHIQVTFPNNRDTHTQYIILDSSSATDTYWYKDSLVFTRTESSDPRKDLIDVTRATENLVIALRNEIIHYLQKDKKIAEQLELLRHPLNPIPKIIKKRVLFESIDKHVQREIVEFLEVTEKEMYKKLYFDSLCSVIKNKEECRAQCVWREKQYKKRDVTKQLCLLGIPESMYMQLMAKCLDDLLNPYFKMKYMPFIKDKKGQKNVILFTPQDIHEGRLDRITSNSTNPFVSRLGYRQQTVNLQIEKLNSQILPRESDERVLRGTNDDAKLEKVPFGLLPDFTRVERNNYKPSTVFSIFETIYKRMKESDMIDMRNLVVNRIYNSILTNYEDTVKQLSNGLSAFKIKSKDPEETAEEYKKYMLNNNGYPSQLEIAHMSEISGVNTVLIVRKTRNSNHKNIKQVFYNKRNKYHVILVERPSAKADKSYRYDLVKKDNRYYIIAFENLPKEFAKLLPKKSYFEL